MQTSVVLCKTIKDANVVETTGITGCHGHGRITLTDMSGLPVANE